MHVRVVPCHWIVVQCVNGGVALEQERGVWWGTVRVDAIPLRARSAMSLRSAPARCPREGALMTP